MEERLQQSWIRPFKDYPKRVPITRYSEEGQIFIKYCKTTL